MTVNPSKAISDGESLRLPSPDTISGVDYVRSHLKCGEMTEGIAEGRELAAQVESVFEAFVRERKVPPSLKDDCYQETWRAVLTEGANVEKYLGAWLKRQHAWRRPSLRSTDVLTEGVSDSARSRAANGYALGVNEEATYGGDSRDSLLANLIENTPRRKGKWRAADTRRETDVAGRMGYDTKAWIAYRRKMGKRSRRSFWSSRGVCLGLSSAADEEDGGMRRRHRAFVTHRKKAVRRKNARDIFWNPGACQPPRVPTPLHILIAKEDLVCPWCGRQLALDSAPRAIRRMAGGIIREGCENRRCAALCLCGFWYICCGVSCN